METRLILPRRSPRDAIVEHDLEGDPEAAHEIRRYLALADAALTPKRRSVERQDRKSSPQTRQTVEDSLQFKFVGQDCS